MDRLEELYDIELENYLLDLMIFEMRYLGYI